jgi:aerobic carbon-monoxide dehydrogenase medium subunit
VTDTRYLRPGSLAEALEMMGEHWPGAKLLAGGTDLIPLFRAARYSSDSDPAGLGSQGGCKCGDCRIVPFPDVLVDVGGLDEIKGVRRSDGYLEVGAATVIAAVASDTLLVERAPVLAEGARSIGNPLIRNRATIGGNLATAAPCADTAPPLLALDAIVQLAGPEGRREIPMADYFLEYRTTSLRETEMITGLRIPIPPEGAAGSFEKVRLRRSGAISVASVAVQMQLDGATCRSARVALGSVAPIPLRATAVERALEGRRIDAEVVKECSRLVQQHISPIDDLRGSAEYRRWVTEAVVARTILKAAGIEGTD